MRAACTNRSALVAAAVAFFVATLVCTSAFASLPSPAVALPTEASPGSAGSVQPAAPVSSLRRSLAIATAVVPGTLVSGGGQWVLGHARAGQRLLIAKGLGAGALALGAISLAATGASDRVSVPSIWVSTLGGSAFVTAWLADIYGAVTPAGGTGRPVIIAPQWVVATGYRHVRNPAQAANHLSRTTLHGRLGVWALDTEAQVAVDDSQWRLRTLLKRRFLGPAAGPPRNMAHIDDARDGAFLDAWVGYVHHRFGSFGAAEAIGELGTRGRLDLRRLGASLRGAFVEAAIGIGMGASLYDRHGAEYTNLVIAEGRFGIYLGHDETGWSELSGFYQQRHDGFVGGAKLPSAASGGLGRLGANYTLALTERWGVALGAAVGAARVFDVALIRRQGGSR